MPSETQDEGERRIVEATARCVNRLGAEHTILAAVAEESGVSRRTIYRYFDGIEDLFAAVGRLAMDDFQARLDAATVGCTDVVTLRHGVSGVRDRGGATRPLAPPSGRLGPAENLRPDRAEPAGDRLLPPGCRADQSGLGGAGLRRGALNDLVVFIQRILQSFLAAPDPKLEAPELRAFLRRWLGPAVLVRGQWPANSGRPNN